MEENGNYYNEGKSRLTLCNCNPEIMELKPFVVKLQEAENFHLQLARPVALRSKTQIPCSLLRLIFNAPPPPPPPPRPLRCDMPSQETSYMGDIFIIKRGRV